MGKSNKRDRAVSKQINATTIGSLSITSASPVVAAGANPTKAEYDVAVALINELKADVNLLIAALKT